MRFVLITASLLVAMIMSPAVAEWQSSPGNAAAHRHFSGQQITASSVADLEPLWQFDSGQRLDFDTVQSTPVFTGNAVVTVTIAGDVVALEPASGEVIWRTSLAPPAGRRGIAYRPEAEGGGSLFVPSRDGVHRLDAATGKQTRLFRSGLSLLQPIPIGETLYVATLHEGLKAFDMASGDLVWHRPLDKSGVKVRVWSGFSADVRNDILLVTTSNPGGLVGGRNDKDYSVSIIAINAGDGSVRWQYQHIRNDVWDLDLVSNPIVLHKLKIGPSQQTEDVVIGLSKTGEVLVLRLADGKPVFPGAIQQLPTATASRGGDAEPVLQNRAVWPEALAGLEIDLDRDFSRHRGAQADYIETKLRHARSGWLLPTSVDYDLVIYGLHGGPEWPGASLVARGDGADLIVPFNRNPWILRVHYGDKHFDEWRDRLEPLDDAAASVGKIGAWLARCWDRPFSCDETNATGMSKVLTRWSHRDWQGSEANGWFTRMIYPRLSDSISDKTYQKSCASCHGVGRQGAYQSEFFGDGYIPPLTGFTLTEKWQAADTLGKLQATHDAYGIDLPISETDYQRMMALFDSRDREALAASRLTKRGFWQLLLDRDGLPATNPPWGKITSLDLTTGIRNWSVPFGKRALDSGVPGIAGDINFGGVLTTDGAVAFATGTPDRMLRAFDVVTGEELWRHELSFAGSAPPMGFHFRGCDIVVVKATGGRFFGFDGTGDATIAFKSGSCRFQETG